MEDTLKVWLRPNELTPDPTDSIAIVSPAGKIDKQGVIDSIVAEGVEIKRETLEDVVNRYNRKCASFALSGWNVDTGLVYMRSVVTGAVYGMKFDKAKNSVYVSCSQGINIRKEAANTKVEILGMMPDAMYIAQVINMQSRANDCTLTRGRNVTVEGSHLKVVGDDPYAGVYLINDETGNEIKLEDDLLVVNEPSKLLLLIPAEMPTGTYRLKVVTQYTAGNKRLKGTREAVYSQELTVV